MTGEPRKRRFLRLPSPAMGVAMIALAVALGGTATAGGLLLTGADIKDNSLTGADVKNASLTARDFRGTIPASVDVDHLVSDEFTNPAESQTFGSVACEPGTTVVGGGVATSGGWGLQRVNASYPVAGDGTDEQGTGGWGVYVDNNDTAPHRFWVYAICVPGS